MKKLIAGFLAVVMTVCLVGCKSDSNGKNGGTAAKRTSPLKYGINAHLYEQRPMDPSSTLDYCSDMIGVVGFEYYRLSTPLESMFEVGEGDTLAFKEGFKNTVHKIIEKMSAAGVKKFVAVSDALIYPYGYGVTSSGVVPDPASEYDIYMRWVKLYAKACGMLVKEFPEITYLEPMNEPDIAGANVFTKQGHQWGVEDGLKYSITDKAHMIADLQYYIYKEVKANNPKVQVTTPGFSSFGEGQEILDDLYEAIESGAHPSDADKADTNPDDYFDAINFHHYYNDNTLDEYFEHCDTFYKATERHNDPGKPALLTECGFTDHGNDGKRDLNGKKMTELLELYNKKMPYIEVAMFYMLNDYYNYSVDASEDNFGLFFSAGDPEKPSCPKPAIISLYKYMHNTKDVSPLYKYCPELMNK